MKKSLIAAVLLSPALIALPAAGLLAQPNEASANPAAPLPEWALEREVSHGDVHTLQYHSTSLDRDREAIVYLPPGYSINPGRYPVLYLLHGAGGDQRTWVDRQQANVILDNLIAEGRLEPLVVVMPYNYTRRLPAGQRRGGPADYKPDMEEFVVDFFEDLMPLVESRYKVEADASHRAIAGLSMGGGQSLAIGLTRPEMFSAVAGFSSAMQIANSPDWGGIDMAAALARADTINEHLDLLWVGCGTDDSLFAVNQSFSAQLTAAGIEHVFRVTGGGHTPEVWRRYLRELAPQLFVRD